MKKTKREADLAQDEIGEREIYFNNYVSGD